MDRLDLFPLLLSGGSIRVYPYIPISQQHAEDGVREKSVAIASQSRIGQQVTQGTAQQSRPQIIIIVTCRHVVNADQDGRVQDDDLTQKHNLNFGTHGTEQLPGSAVFLARCSVSTILLFFLLHLIVYDGGGGGAGLWCRVLCHFSNEVSPYARLVFIVEWTSALASIQLLNLEG